MEIQRSFYNFCYFISLVIYMLFSFIMLLCAFIFVILNFIYTMFDAFFDASISIYAPFLFL